MNTFLTIILSCVMFGITYGLSLNKTVINKMDSPDPSVWLYGPNGMFCGPPENSDYDWAGCQGTKNISDKLLHVEYESGAMPGAEFGQTSPYNKKLTHFGFTELKYIKVEFTFAMGSGSSRLESGGVETNSATVSLYSPKCSAYAYKIQYYG